MFSVSGNITNRILSVLLLFVLLFPMAEKLNHYIGDHQHSTHKTLQTVSLELEAQCDCSDYQFNPLYYSPKALVGNTSSECITTKAERYEVDVTSEIRLTSNLRAPPVLV